MIELTGDHQDRDPDRDQRHLGQEPEHAAHVLVRQEEPVRGDLEQDDEQRQQHDAGEFGLVEIDLEQTFHGPWVAHGSDGNA